MPTSSGTFNRDSANRLEALFIIDGITLWRFTANVTPSLPPFDTYSVWLTYNDIDDLSSRRTYHGLIGESRFKITLKNGPTIEGAMEQPGLSPAVTVTGSGTWESD
ncbi:hypothetical protein C8Q75DRAFT_326783 [Abortiporus biennis]|nr:hypothetical protein C8Q75DRAFT_326783 [Abortiporus biennis]